MITQELTEELVTRELHGEQLTSGELLTLANNLPAWRLHLATISRRVDVQIVDRKAQVEIDLPTNPRARTEFKKWRSSAIFFKNKVVERMHEVKEKMRLHHESEMIAKAEKPPVPQKEATAKELHEMTVGPCPVQECVEAINHNLELLRETGFLKVISIETIDWDNRGTWVRCWYFWVKKP